MVVRSADDQKGERVNATTCTLCNDAVLPEQKYCTRCEQLLGGVKPPGPSKPKKWYHNVWVVLFMLFFVLGPFGLPLVWKNPSFSRWIKIALTLAMVVYTLALVDVTLRAARAVMNEIGQLNTAF